MGKENITLHALRVVFARCVLGVPRSSTGILMFDYIGGCNELKYAFSSSFYRAYLKIPWMFIKRR